MRHQEVIKWKWNMNVLIHYWTKSNLNISKLHNDNRGLRQPLIAYRCIPINSTFDDKGNLIYCGLSVRVWFALVSEQLQYLWAYLLLINSPINICLMIWVGTCARANAWSNWQTSLPYYYSFIKKLCKDDHVQWWSPHCVCETHEDYHLETVPKNT